MIQAYGKEFELMIVGALSPATRKDYIRAEDKLQSTSSLICLQAVSYTHLTLPTTAEV